MAELATIARPYAQALFSVAEKESIADWSAFIAELAQVGALPEVLSVASSPKVSHAQVVDLLLAAVKSPLTADVGTQNFEQMVVDNHHLISTSPQKTKTGTGAEAKNFVQMLVDNHRLAALPEIHAQFDELKNAREGAADAQIVSAFPLEGAQLADLVASLEHKFQRKLKPTVEVDPSLIGGVCVTVGDEVLDMSVRARLASMQVALTA